MSLILRFPLPSFQKKKKNLQCMAYETNNDAIKIPIQELSKSATENYSCSPKDSRWLRTLYKKFSIAFSFQWITQWARRLSQKMDCVRNEWFTVCSRHMLIWIHWLRQMICEFCTWVPARRRAVGIANSTIQKYKFSVRKRAQMRDCGNDEENWIEHTKLNDEFPTFNQIHDKKQFRDF